MNNHTWIKLAREESWTRNGGRCSYCTCHLSRKDVTADHKTPRIKHGLDRKENIVAACRFCNKAKGSMPADKFRAQVRGRKPPKNMDILMCAIVHNVARRGDQAVKRIKRVCR